MFSEYAASEVLGHLRDRWVVSKPYEWRNNSAGTKFQCRVRAEDFDIARPKDRDVSTTDQDHEVDVRTTKRDGCEAASYRHEPYRVETVVSFAHNDRLCRQRTRGCK